MIVYFISTLGQAGRDGEVNFYMVNTGWAGGHYGTGSRIKLANTSAKVNAALEGKLGEVTYTFVAKCRPASEKSYKAVRLRQLWRKKTDCSIKGYKW